jgi:hypothetical protein
MFSAQTQKDIQFSELFDSVFGNAKLCNLEAELHVILQGRLLEKTENEALLIETLKDLDSTMQKLIEFHAWKTTKPLGQTPAQLIERKNNTEAFERLAATIKEDAKKHAENLSAQYQEKPSDRNSRWLKRTAEIMAAKNSTEAEAMREVFKDDLIAGRPVPSDAKGVYYKARRAAKAPK